MSGEKKKIVSIALERRVVSYPQPKYFNLLSSFTQCNEMKQSEAVAHIIKDFFDRMPESERQRIIHNSKNHY